MLKNESPGDGGGCSSNNWARVCDTCRAAACTVYCRADSAYLCAGCDARVHAANRVASRHERVWVCEACERAPAAFLCKADAASLCTACDADIHSANPLARRHQRVPILPISGCLYGPQVGPATGETTEDMFMTQEGEEGVGDEDDEAVSWLLLNPAKNSNRRTILGSCLVVERWMSIWILWSIIQIRVVIRISILIKTISSTIVFLIRRAAMEVTVLCPFSVQKQQEKISCINNTIISTWGWSLSPHQKLLTATMDQLVIVSPFHQWMLEWCLIQR
ncbi:hypothetical protein P3X46_029611 [Hevea brasiliensis]|uniref:B box-type domain-containing protein n=1 Tax=Hevea brasiliensis TaxID=3981 RepID=A0ABQ9KU51_HEVBR|nr:hypothetical protein P3X46_029611 [Hevea brasiliensis]